MVQGAPQVAGRFPDTLRMYKAPPPEVSSETNYETDQARGFARGFSIQTVSPLPIGWAQHVLADGHWGQALREYMRDYNHWSVLGALCELLPCPENRVTLADERDESGTPLARFDYTQCDNDRASIAYAKGVLNEIWDAAGAQDVLSIDRYAYLIGGCRMGTSPENSVVDSDHRCWEVPNLSSPTAAHCRPRAAPSRRLRSWRSARGLPNGWPRDGSRPRVRRRCSAEASGGLHHGEYGYRMPNRVPLPCGAAVSHSSVRKPWRSQAQHQA